MLPDIYWIHDIQPLRVAIMPRPRGGDWLADEITAWSEFGLQTVVSLLHRYEAEELGLLNVGALCERQGICYRSFPIADRGVPDNETALLSTVRELVDSVKAGFWTSGPLSGGYWPVGAGDRLHFVATRRSGAGDLSHDLQSAKTARTGYSGAGRMAASFEQANRARITQSPEPALTQPLRTTTVPRPGECCLPAA